MKSTFIIPSERVPDIGAIKKALLCYDEVLLSDPADRDLFPPQVYLQAVAGMGGLPFMFGGNVGAVRPLGKIKNYDRDFESLLEQLSVPVREGLVKVVSTYDRQSELGTDEIRIGTISTGGYPLNPSFVLQVYRSFARQPDLQQCVLDPGAIQAAICEENYETLSLKGVGDGLMLNLPALELLDAPGFNDEQQKSISMVARGRLGALVKYTGFCEQKDLVPSYASEGYSRSWTKILSDVNELIAPDPFWSARGRVLDVAFEVLLGPGRLEELTIHDILKLRTRVWKKFEADRLSFFDSIFELASNVEGNGFEREVRKKIEGFRKTAGDLEAERKCLNLRIKLGIGQYALGVGLALSNPNAMSLLQSPFNSVAATLAAAMIWGFQNVAMYEPLRIKLKQTEAEARRGAGYAITDYFRHLK